jgi:signal peptidase I
MQPVNPYAAGAMTSDRHPKRPPRWLAVLVSALTINFAGAGLFLLRRSRRNWVLPALTVALMATYALSALAAPRLVVPVLAAIALVWLVGVVVTFRARASEFVGWQKTLLLAAGLVLASQVVARTVKAFAVETFQIPAASMVPTLLVGDHVVVTKAADRPARGDVVVFKYPLGPKTEYIKRVIGLPGETISIRQNQVLIDGQPLPRRRLDEPCPVTEGGSCQLWEEQAGGRTYRIQHEPDRPALDFGPHPIPPGHYFVIGDNRDNSNDSRVWGTVPAALIVGRGVVTLLSTSPQGQRWGRVGKPVD